MPWCVQGSMASRGREARIRQQPRCTRARRRLHATAPEAFQCMYNETDATAEADFSKESTERSAAAVGLEGVGMALAMHACCVSLRLNFVCIYTVTAVAFDNTIAL